MSEDKKESRFLKKWKLVRAAARDKHHLSMGDVSVLMALCDRYGSKYDPDAPALAGHAILGAMSGLSRRATIDSTRRLLNAGYISVVELGSGTRGTRYGLSFTRGEDHITTRKDSSSGEAQFTTVVNPGAPLDPLSGEAHFTESPPTESRLQAGLHVVGNNFEAAPMAPLTVGLAATAAESAPGEFGEFWKTWPRKHGKKKAELEWSRLDRGQRDQAIASASAWALHYSTNGTDTKWIPEPANWLKNERWDEDLPLIHMDAKGAAIAKAKANGPAKPTERTAPSSLRTTVTEKLRILSVEEIGSQFSDYRVRLKFDDASGNVVEHVLHALDEGGSGEDFDAYNSICEISNDLTLWPGQRVYLEMDGGSVVKALPAKSGERLVTIVSAPIRDRDSERTIVAELQAAGGDGVNEPEGFLEITFESRYEAVQKRGQIELTALIKAVGLHGAEDTDDLCFRPFVITDNGEFLPAPVNDNDQAEAA